MITEANYEAHQEFERLRDNYHRVQGVITPEALLAAWFLFGDEMWVSECTGYKPTPAENEMFKNQETVDYAEAAGISNDDVIINEEKHITGAQALALIDEAITAMKVSGVWNKLEAIYDFRLSQTNFKV